MNRRFLDFSDFNRAAHERLLSLATARKKESLQGRRQPLLGGRLLLMLFEKASTRTRVSFAAAMAQSGGQAVSLDADGSQMARGESIADTARAVSAMCDAVMIRARRHETLLEFARHAHCPLINGLSERSHPCQVLADILTYRELRGALDGGTVAWIGDCNNVYYSWAEAATIFGFRLQVATPPKYRPPRAPSEAVVFVDGATAAAKNATLVMTDVWVSMGDEESQKQRRADFSPYRVDDEVMKNADADALFMHCLPAHRGEEVTAAVIDGKQSAVWRQAENRLHAQKALLEILILGDGAAV